ncbi:MAG: hypothetical protein U1E91_05975 [Moraxella sp.]
MPAILREYNVSLVAIGWSGLIWYLGGLNSCGLLSWTATIQKNRTRQKLDFADARAVNRHPNCGGIFEPHNLAQTRSVMTLYGMLFTLSLIGATHDVATDGLATRLLKTAMAPKEPLTHDIPAPDSVNQTTNHHHRQSQGNAVQVIGYRLG